MLKLNYLIPRLLPWNSSFRTGYLVKKFDFVDGHFMWPFLFTYHGRLFNKGFQSISAKCYITRTAPASRKAFSVTYLMLDM